MRFDAMGAPMIPRPKNPTLPWNPTPPAASARHDTLNLSTTLGSCACCCGERALMELKEGSRHLTRRRSRTRGGGILGAGAAPAWGRGGRPRPWLRERDKIWGTHRRSRRRWWSRIRGGKMVMWVRARWSTRPEPWSVASWTPGPS
jgi:hypothetical protein